MTFEEAMTFLYEVGQFHLKKGHGKYAKQIFEAIGAIREKVDEEAKRQPKKE